MNKRTFNPCDECKYGIDQRDGSGSDHMCKICEFNALLNRRAQPENKPLTLDELKQMDGKPVWIVTLDGTADPIWEIIVSAGEHGIDLICVLNGVETSDYADFDLYNDTWLAYRNKPVKEE